MNCQELRKFIHAYFDGELVEEDRIEYAAHLQTCEACQKIARFEEQLRQRLRELPQEPAPATLHNKLALALDQEERRPKRSWSWLFSRRLAPVAVAAVVVVSVLQVVVFSQQGVNEQKLRSLAEASIRFHQQRLPLDVKGSQPEIRRYFNGKVPFAVRPPRFSDPRARLIGARLSNLGAHQAAYLVYQVGQQRVSVFVVDSGAMPKRQERVSWRDTNGYPVAFFRSNGTGYAVTTDLDRRSLVRLIKSVP